jgi:hypothetical protein
VIESEIYEPKDGFGMSVDDWATWLNAEGFDVELDKYDDEVVYEGEGLNAYFRDFGIFMDYDGELSETDNELVSFIENRPLYHKSDS